MNPQGPWEGRHAAGYVVYRDRMWIVGGDCNQKHYQNDVWSSADGVHWDLVNDSVPWAPRALHYTLAFDGRIWVIGGQTMPGFAGGGRGLLQRRVEFGRRRDLDPGRRAGSLAAPGDDRWRRLRGRCRRGSDFGPTTRGTTKDTPGQARGRLRTRKTEHMGCGKGMWTIAAILIGVACGAVGAAGQDREGDSMAVPANGYLINGDLSRSDGEGPHGWEVRGDFTYDVERLVGTLTYEVSGSLVQEVSLPPGHYLLEAVLRTNSAEATMFVDALDYDVTGTNFISPSYGLFRIPIGVTEDLKTAQLPFFVEVGVSATSVTVGLQAREARAGLEGQDQEPKRMEIRSISVTRLGDTELERRWAQNLQLDPIHGLRTLKEAADFERPGFAIFSDTYTGAELWLIAQGRQSHLQYPGVSYFSESGKYVFVSRPGVIMRTDGSGRFTGHKRKRGGVPWLPAWLQKQLPRGADLDDWIEVATTDEAVTLRNVVSGREMRVEKPTRDGWTLALLPSVKSPMLEREGAPNETAVWVSEDKRTIGLSAVDGGDFLEIPVKTHSPDPGVDYLFEPFWCKGWDGGWYVGYMLNWLPLHNQIRKTPENSINPGQIWALPVARDDPRGPLLVTGGYQKLQGMRLEDGSVVQRAESLVGGHKAMDGSLRYRVDAGKV
ncbi:MAG: hypothetical protein QGI83_03305, partial [Candidatus Latescibacteria bacterium]|nr:hypothetical protein [Candidatus Latescibacterota bacterium]